MHTHRRTDQKQQCHSLNQVKWTGEWGPLASVSGIHSVRIAAGKPYQTPLLIRMVTCEAVSSSAPSRGPDCKAACRPAYGLLPGRWTQKKGQRLCEPASFLPSHYPLRFIPFAMGRHVGEKTDAAILAGIFSPKHESREFKAIHWTMSIISLIFCIIKMILSQCKLVNKERYK